MGNTFVIRDTRKCDTHRNVHHMLSLLLEFKSEGFDTAIRYKNDSDKKYLVYLNEITPQELQLERKRLTDMLIS